MGSPWSQEKYITALKYAAEAHHGQKVPGSDLPYIVHVTMVAMEVIAALEQEDNLDGDLAVQCALLHDVIEDTQKTHADLAAVFGERVADGVQALSKDDGLENKQAKMADSLERIKQQPKEIWMVKLADRITNLQPPPGHWSAEKIEQYREEAKEILAALGDAGKFLSERLGDKLLVYSLEG